MTGKYGCRVDASRRIGEDRFGHVREETAAVLQVENYPGREKTEAVRRGESCLAGIRWQQSGEVKTVP